MPDRRRYERTPDTLALLSACAVTAGALTLTGHVPRSVVDLAPYWVALVWSAALALAAAAALACAAAATYLGCLLVVWVALTPLRATAHLLGGGS